MTVTFASRSYTADIPPSYVITAQGMNALHRAEGRSRHAVAPKNIYFEMLATGGRGDEQRYLRTRRALLVEHLSGSNVRTTTQLLTHTTGQQVVSDLATIKDDLEGLKRIGLNIVSPAPDSYTLKDPVRYLAVPRAVVPTPSQNQALKAQLRTELQHVPHTYLDLLDLAFDGSSDRLFEARIMQLLSDAGFSGGHQGGASRPDGAFWTQTGTGDYGLIVDAKAYANGFSCTAGSRDEMMRYLVQNTARPANHRPAWWTVFPATLTAPNDFRFLFVSGAFISGFVAQFQQLSGLTSQTLGAGITAETLLRYAESVLSGQTPLSDGRTRFATLGEVVFP